MLLRLSFFVVFVVVVADAIATDDKDVFLFFLPLRTLIANVPVIAFIDYV